MPWPWLLALAVLAVGVIVAVIWHPMRVFGREVQVGRARELFRLQRERLEAQFLTAASSSGKPRGLRWSDVAFDDGLELARDRRSGQIVALAPITIQFE